MELVTAISHSIQYTGRLMCLGFGRFLVTFSARTLTKMNEFYRGFTQSIQANVRNSTSN
jgi:hypothetical protein